MKTKKPVKRINRRRGSRVRNHYRTLGEYSKAGRLYKVRWDRKAQSVEFREKYSGRIKAITVADVFLLTGDFFKKAFQVSLPGVLS